MTRQMTRVNAIVDKIAGLIGDGLLKPGERLLSVRAGAVEHGVSKNTMAEAYDRLVALGYLEAKQGSGYYVARVRRASAEQQPAHVAEAVDFVSLLREQLVQTYSVRIGDGRPPPSWMERFEIGSAPRFMAATRGLTSEHGYGSPWGFLPLRERLALTLGERSVKVSPDQILLTQGANHALDLVARQMLEPGDTVLVDSPGYYPLFGKLRLSRIAIIGVQRRQDGPDLDDLAAKAAAHKPKLFFTQSLAHNPTGGSITPAVAHRLLQIAGQHGFYVVEDDPFADVLPAASPRLAALDQLDRVIYVGTFSKTLSASLRVGYVAAKRPLIDRLCDVKMLTIVSTSDYVERIVYGFIASGHYLRHLRRLRTRIEEHAEKAMLALGRIGVRLPPTASGSYYLWGELPDHVDELGLAHRAAERGIFLAPGSLFMPAKMPTTPAMRINIAYADDPRFTDFLAAELHAGRRPDPKAGGSP